MKRLAITLSLMLALSISPAHATNKLEKALEWSWGAFKGVAHWGWEHRDQIRLVVEGVLLRKAF